jgi:hypothetical protein
MCARTTIQPAPIQTGPMVPQSPSSRKPPRVRCSARSDPSPSRISPRLLGSSRVGEDHEGVFPGGEGLLFEAALRAAHREEVELQVGSRGRGAGPHEAAPLDDVRGERAGASERELRQPPEEVHRVILPGDAGAILPAGGGADVILKVLADAGEVLDDVRTEREQLGVRR